MQNSQQNPGAAMQQAQARAQAGDLKGAAEICREVLKRAPSDFYALFMLGTIEGEFKRYDEAARLLGRAVKLNPKVPEILSSYGNILLELKRHDEAIDVLNKALALQPQNQNALIYRGLGLAETGKPKQALKDFDRVLALDPRSVFALHNRANVLLQLNRQDEARRSVEALLRIAPTHVLGMTNLATILVHDKKYDDALRVVEAALALEPANPDLWHSRAQVLHKLKRYNEALTLCDRAIQMRPDSTDYLLTRGNLCAELERYDEALEAYDKAIALNPRFAEAYLSRANIMMERQDLEAALHCCEKALAARHDYAGAMLLRGNILLNQGKQSEAFASFDAAIAAEPNYHDAYYHRGSAMLLTGYFAQGWRDFEHRWQATDCGGPRPLIQAAEWRGEPLEGKSLVIDTEQGLGDRIQFARYLLDLARMKAKLTLFCHPSLIRLFRPFQDTMEIIPTLESGRRFDFQCAMMSLPDRLGIPVPVPDKVPYLFAEEALVAKWRQRIGPNGFRIGLCWQGNPEGKVDKGRSIPLAKFRPLATIPGVRLISLQKNHGLEQLADLPEDMTIETLGEFDTGGDAFVDTAAIMQNLDLVITSDTAIPHLAGALDRPVWVGLKAMPDWRWMLGRSDSPWYKSLRLFRQPVPGDWDSVFRTMAEELSILVGRYE